MANDLIHDRGRGPEIVGTRITVYNLLPHLLSSNGAPIAASLCSAATKERAHPTKASLRHPAGGQGIRHGSKVPL